MRFGFRTLVTLAIAAFIIVGLSGPAANALTRAPAVTSFVGTYKVHGTINGGGNVKGTLTVNADGTATDQHGRVAHWTSSGKTFTLVYKDKDGSETFVGKQSKKGIGTKQKPGTFSTSSGFSGTWYAVKTSSPGESRMKGS